MIVLSALCHFYVAVSEFENTVVMCLGRIVTILVFLSLDKHFIRFGHLTA